MIPAWVLSVLIALIVLGVALKLLDLIDMDGTVKQAGKIVVIAVVVIWLLQILLGNLPGLIAH